MLKLIPVFIMFAALFSCHSEEIRSDFAANLQQDSNVYIRIPQKLVSRNFVKYTRFNRDSKYDNYYAFGYLPRQAFSILPENYKSSIDIVNPRTALLDFDTKTLSLKDLRLKGRSLYAFKEGYHDYDALTQEMKKMASKFPHLAQLTSAGKSVKGRELWMMKISDKVQKEENEPKLLYIANMHGDEVVGREMMIYFIRALLGQYNKSPRVKHLVDNSQIYIMPSMNPDGFENGRRFNANGTDLNRNFPDFTSDPNDSPRGRAPETKAVMALHKKHHFILAINFHGGAVCFNLPWDTKPNKKQGDRFGDDLFLKTLGRAYTKSNTDMYNGDFDRGLTYGYEWYEVNGGLQDWANYYRRSIHATVELSNAKWPASEKLSDFWKLNEKAMFNYLEAGLMGFHFDVVDRNGQPVLGKVKISNQASKRVVTYDNYSVHRPALPAKQKVRIAAAGYKVKEVEMSPWKFDGRMKKIALEKQ